MHEPEGEATAITRRAAQGRGRQVFRQPARIGVPWPALMSDLGQGSTVAGKYRLERLIGRGGMGSVWAARHLQLDTLVAIKFIDAVTDIGDARVRFEREARAAAQLRSPHVVQILDHGIDEEGQPYIAMELLEGEDLGERLRRTPRLSLQATATIITQASKALRRAHESGVIHRDLKPGNIFLARFDDDEVVKLLDFGVAKLRYNDDLAPGVQMTQTGVIFGSPSYMSPEQARGNRVIDHRTDLWSLAVILFRCITGVKPFEAGSIGDLVIKLCIDPLPMPTKIAPDLPAEVDPFFEKAFARDPDLRFPTAAALALEFEAIAARAAAVAAMPAIPPPPPPRAPMSSFREPMSSFREQPPGPSQGAATFTPMPEPRNSAPRFEAPPPSSPTPSRSMRMASNAAPMPSNVLGVLSTFSGSYVPPPSPPSQPDLREVPPAAQSHPFGAATGAHGAATGGYGAPPPAEPAPQPSSMTPSPALMAVSAFAASLPLRSQIIAAASLGGGALLLLVIVIAVAVHRRAPDPTGSPASGDKAAASAAALAPIVLPSAVASAAPEPPASAAPEPSASAAAEPAPAGSAAEPEPDPASSASPATSASGRKPGPGKQGRGRTPNFGY
jgi:serine/threonine protein kinase